jgi:hypothetical protein
VIEPRCGNGTQPNAVSGEPLGGIA